MNEPLPADRRSRSHRRWLPAAAIGAVLFVIAATLAGVTAALRDDDVPAVAWRDDPASDLVGWLPVDAETRRAFAVWIGEPELATDDANQPGTNLPNRLGLEPMPLTLGRGRDWRTRFGYAAGDVTGWAVGGRANGGVAVLAGRFDAEAIATALTAAGYRETSYQGARLFVLQELAAAGPIVDGDAASAANALALLEGRVVTAGDPAPVKAAIDAATGNGPSLADDSGVSRMLTTLGPVAGMMAIDAADHAAACGIDAAGWHASGRPPSGRLVTVAYGRLGLAGIRRTLVAVRYEDEGAATAADGRYQGAWLTGRIVAGAAVADVSAFGLLGNVSQTGPLLVAELLDGRTDGWAPTGVRFAEAVCGAVADAIPEDLRSEVRPPAAARLDLALASLLDAGEEGAFLAADLAAITAAGGLEAPAGDDREQIDAWLDGLGALPTFTIFPLETERLARWPATLGISFADVELVAEARAVGGEPTVGVLVGRWDANRIAGALKGQGYQAIYLGDALHLGLAQKYLDDDDHPTRLAGGTAWDNVAILGDRVFVSPSIRALRAAVDAAVAAGGEPNPATLRTMLLASEPEAVAVEVVGAEAGRQGCIDAGGGALAPSWRALAAIRSVGLEGEGITIAALPGAEETLATIGTDLDEQFRLARMATADGSDPGPSLDAALGYVGMERSTLLDRPEIALAVARFAPDPAEMIAPGFFAATAEGCQLVQRR